VPIALDVAVVPEIPDPTDVTTGIDVVPITENVDDAVVVAAVVVVNAVVDDKLVVVVKDPLELVLDILLLGTTVHCLTSSTWLFPAASTIGVKVMIQVSVTDPVGVVLVVTV